MSPPGYHVVLPGAADTPTGGFVYDRRMLAALRQAGHLASCLVLPGAYPRPSAAAIAAARGCITSLPGGARVVIDGLALTPLAEPFARIAQRSMLIALIHHPLAEETGLAAAERARLLAAEREALRLVRGVIVTSAHTARRLTGLGVQPERIRVVPPGAEPPRGVVRALREKRDASVLLCVGTLTPRKGQDVLVRALSRLREDPWRLLLAGAPRDRAYARRLRRAIHSRRLGNRIAMLGEVRQPVLARLYRDADVFVAPSRYEGFGMAAADAVVQGLQVVASDAGALPEALRGSRCRLVPPGDPAALAAALRPLLASAWLPARFRPPPYRTWAAAQSDFVAALDALSG